MSVILGFVVGCVIALMGVFELKTYFAQRGIVTVKDEYKLGRKMLKEWVKEERKMEREGKYKEYEDLLRKGVIWVL